MIRTVASSPNGLPIPGFRHRPAWAIVLLALIAWQGWMTLSLFGQPVSWQPLLDDRPIVSGKHPLHAYHGYLGARSFLERGSTCCYDPAFQAGYPKTPVFDSGSRPAEVFLVLGGGHHRPAAYKIGLAICCLLAPLALALAARGVGLPPGASCLAVGIGLLIWWSTLGRNLLSEGELDVQLGGLALLTHTAWLVRYDRTPGPWSWLVLLVAATVGWFVHPVLFVATLPLLLVYYFSAGVKHPLIWHVFLAVTVLGGILVNAFWLLDWLRFWWMQAPTPAGAPLLAQRTLRAFWAADLWGRSGDRLVILILLFAGSAGVIVWYACRQRQAARLCAAAAIGFFVLVLLGAVHEPIGRFGVARLLVPALWFATLPAVGAFQRFAEYVLRVNESTRRRLVAAGLFLATGGVLLSPTLAQLRHPGPSVELGLNEARQEVIATLREHTTAEARILWEDRPATSKSGQWTSLLPLATGRSFLGGIDPDNRVEHAQAGFRQRLLAGQPIETWSNEDLEEYCRRYNIGWVVCWSPEAIARFGAWDLAEAIATLHDRDAGRLFVIRRPRSYILKGKATLVHADHEYIALADVVPENGEVILSLHHLKGLVASPRRVVVEREPDPVDPIPLIRLRVPGPVARVILTWEP